MGKSVLKNWSPREVVRFLKKNGFTEIKGKGDHCCLFNEITKAYTEVDMGRDAFAQREMLQYTTQTLIPKENWKKGKKVKTTI
ncbi:type II toxin-antitoxin system HicA family toxin [Candidatus Peregrinibacteria bacterium]|nr:type II toxin-antitoxin system HicA family toxin [Candidatus Peregrinibacteria bacterium]